MEKFSLHWNKKFLEAFHPNQTVKLTFYATDNSFQLSHGTHGLVASVWNIRRLFKTKECRYIVIANKQALYSLRYYSDRNLEYFSPSHRYLNLGHTARDTKEDKSVNISRSPFLYGALQTRINSLICRIE